MPKSEREKLVADKQELQNNSTTRILELRFLADIVVTAFKEILGNSPLLSCDKEDKVLYQICKKKIHNYKMSVNSI